MKKQLLSVCKKTTFFQVFEEKPLVFSKKRQGRCFCRLEIQEFTSVNDCISRQKNEEIGVLLQTLLILLLAIISLTSCKKNGVTACFLSTGEIAMETRSINSFNNILLMDNVNLILKKADSNAIIVEAGKNLISGIKTTVDENNILEIKNDNGCNWIRSYESPINVHVHYKIIDSIDYRSIGDITTENTIVTDSLWIIANEGAGQINLDIDVNTLYCSLHYGTLDIILRGKSGVSYIYSASFGLINTLDMESDYIYINNKSSNDVFVRAKIHLGATIENIGNIYYTGNPITHSFDKLGEGELIELND